MTTDSVYSTQQAASKTGMTPSRASTGGTESTRPEDATKKEAERPEVQT